MENKYKYAIITITLVCSFALGRYSVPLSTKTENTQKESEQQTKEKNQDVSKQKHQETVIVEKEHPDGTKEKTTTIIEDTGTNKKTNTVVDTEKKKESSSIVETSKQSSRLTISALAGAPVKFSGPLEPVYGGMVTKDILGPLHIGAFGFNSGLAGVAVGISF